MRAVAVAAFKAEPALVHVPKPEPGAGEILVKVEFAALNPYDWQVADGLLDGQAPHVFPLVMGVDFSGRVHVVGPGEHRFVVGDRVFGQVSRPPVGAGTYAEYVTVPQDSALTEVPETLDLRTAATLPTSGMTAAQILQSGAVLRPGETLLVVGAAGGVGSVLTQLARARGVRVIAAVRGAERERMAALGAAFTVDTTEEPLESRVREECPDGVDAVVDLVSDTPDAFAAHARLVRPGGTALTTRYVADPALVPVGVDAVNFGLKATAALLDTLAAAAATGDLKVPVDAELPLEKAPQALAQNRSGGARGKTVFAV
ncbi:MULTISPECIES: NADP-dependent oxidoreductase [unclassified Streptomyces]|uniref:NADP-dependent oxidoreductase n=1 Tax=unclassified Streptomyces TaxID=2593676 RepID=UPI00381030DF